MLRLHRLTCNALTNPLGIGGEAPLFGWQLDADGEGILQTAYRLQVSLEPDFEDVLWDSGQVPSRESVQAPYAGPGLAPRTLYFWRAQATDTRGQQSGWSQIASFETGLWGDDWAGAQFISPEPEDNPSSMGGFLLRREFKADQPIKSARAYATAHGVYHLSINGEAASSAQLTPGWTNYEKRLQVQACDVTDWLKEGRNAIGIHLGPGWYKSNLADWQGRDNRYGNRLAALLRLDVLYADGTEETVVTGPDWRCAQSPVLESTIYDGEICDAGKWPIGWDLPGFDDAIWRQAAPADKDFSTLLPQQGPFVRAQEALKPAALFTTPKGETVLDFGQNLTGWVRLRMDAKAGDRVVYTHAEILDADGNFYTENLRGAKQRIEYICRGGGAEMYQPYFTFQGFRYIRVEEFPGDVRADAFEAVVVHSHMPRIGEFRCSEPMIDQLMHNILWGMKGNFLDVPTDCPQRDERLGWTGDAQIFAATASTLMDTRGFFAKWLSDVASEQQPDGSVPHVVPDVLSRKAKDGVFQGGACGWADAAVIVPWTQYMAYGDLATLKRQYGSMKAWVEYIRQHAQGETLWNSGFHFGDWLALDAQEGSYVGATPNALSATAYYAHSTDLLSQAAEALGMPGDAAEYRALHQRIVQAYQWEFLTDEGLTVQTQTAHVLSLVFDLVPPERKKRVVEDLVALVEEKGHLTTGFLGTPALCFALSQNGALDTAYTLLLRTEYPSWLYPITKGATTIWEHWDGLKPDGSMWSADMNSFNHYAYGAIGQWLFNEVAGVTPTEPGYQRIRIAPKPGGGLTKADATIQTPHGRLHSAWEIQGGLFTLSIQVPHNATANVILPDGTHAEVGSGTYAYTVPME